MNIGAAETMRSLETLNPSLNGRSTGGQILLLGAWFGLLTGALVAAIVVFRQVLLGHLVFYSQWVIWMAPLAHMAIFTVVGAPFVVLALVFRSTSFLGWSAAAYAFVGLLSLLIPFPAVAWWATLLLAAGAAVRCRKLFQSMQPTTARRLTRSAAVTLLAIVAATATVWSASTIRAWRNRGELVAPLGTPNVLLIILDTVRGENMSLYGYDRPTTPFLQRIAGESAVFDQAFATAPWTLPSHASIMTGRYGSQLGAGWLQPADLGPENLARIMGSRGYRTGAFVANLLYTSYESGLAEPFQDYDDYQLSVRQIFMHAPVFESALVRAIAKGRQPSALWRLVKSVGLSPNQFPADDYRPASSVSDAFLAWQGRISPRPFLAFLNYFDAHGPYRAPDQFLERFDTHQRGNSKRDRYDGAIAYLDEELNRLFDSLEARGVLDRTIVIITSDHGELFGEHGLEGHANGLYLPLLRVPLVLRYPPRVPAGIRVSKPVSLIDLPRTVLELAAIPKGGLPGNSLVATWEEGRNEEATSVIAELLPGKNVDSTNRNAHTWLQSALDDSLHYIRDGLGRVELYDWSADPLEQEDIALDPRQHAALARFNRLLDSVLGWPDGNLPR